MRYSIETWYNGTIFMSQGAANRIEATERYKAHIAKVLSSPQVGRSDVRMVQVNDDGAKMVLNSWTDSCGICSFMAAPPEYYA